MILISTTDVTLDTMKSWAKKNNADTDFVEKVIPSIYKQSVEIGINPLFVVAHATKESGWGKFGGQVKREQNNYCGIKTTDNSRFASFSTIDEGVQAHIEHLGLYIGLDGYPLSDTVDPKHFSSLLGKAKSVKDVCKAWTREDNYLEYYVRVMEMVEEMETFNNYEPTIDERDLLIEELTKKNEHIQSNLQLALTLLQAITD